MGIATNANRIGQISLDEPVRIGPASCTVAMLPTPTAAMAGHRAFVTNALTPVFASPVVGGGAVVVPVYCTGSNWMVG